MKRDTPTKMYTQYNRNKMTVCHMADRHRFSCDHSRQRIISNQKINR